MHILLALQAAFSIWMLVDAIRRGAPEYWWLIVLVPFGECAYFFAVKLPDLQFGASLKKLLAKPISLKQLKGDYRQTPSHENKVKLAQALHDHKQYGEAAALFEQILRRHPEDKESLYGYAWCAWQQGDRDMSVRAMEQLVDLDMTYLDFVPCYELADTYWTSGQRDQAIELLQRACKKGQRIGPRARLARYLVEQDRTPEARQLLEDGLNSYDGSPAFVRKRDRRWAREARGLLRRIRSG